MDRAEMTDPIVEKVARIIDPDAWRLPKRVNRAGLLFGPQQLGRQMVSLTKAATIHALYSEREGWRGIESVPVDQRVQLWCSDLSHDLRSHRPAAKGLVFGYAYLSHEGKPVPKGEGMNGDWTFIHWRPLPEPPNPDETTSRTEGGR